MKKELIQEVKRIKQIMNINEGWGNVFRDSFQAMVSSGRIDRIKDVLETLENMQAIDLQTNVSLRRELTSNADTFEDALDTIAKKIERLSDQSDFNKAFDEFIDSLDSSSATKISDDIRKIENASSQDVSDNIKSSITTNMDPEMAKLYKKRLDSVTWKGSSSFTPATVNSSELETIDSYIDNLHNNPTFKRIYPDNDIRQTLINEMKDAIRKGDIPLNNQTDVNNYLIGMQNRFKELSNLAGKGNDLKNYDRDKALNLFFTRLRSIFGSGGKATQDLIDAGGGVITKSIETGGKVGGAATKNGWKIFTGVVSVVILAGLWDYLHDVSILGGLMNRGEEKIIKIKDETFKAANESVKESGGRGVPEVVDEKPPKEETTPAETTPVVNTPKTRQDSINQGLIGAWDPK